MFEAGNFTVSRIRFVNTTRNVFSLTADFTRGNRNRLFFFFFAVNFEPSEKLLYLRARSFKNCVLFVVDFFRLSLFRYEPAG